MTVLLAADLGAESGRVVRGEFGEDRMTVTEVARFPTGVSRIDGRLRWDLNRILGDLDTALGQECARGGVAGVGVDTWGVDFGLLDEDERLIEPPVAYRDPRTDGVMERFFGSVRRSEIFERTGIQFLPFNTLYQLAAMAEAGDPALARARHLLLMPDLVHHHLTGERTTEFTNATTTQCFDSRTHAWADDLIEAAGASPSLMQDVVGPGTVIGDARLSGVPVVAPATHDTASAVAAVPARGGNWAYISSGTWSLMGAETEGPLITAEARERNFTNEGGIAGTNRFLKNIVGLWLVQQIRAERDSGTGYGDLVRQAAESPPLASLIDPGDTRFLNPPSMSQAIADFCAESGQPVPATTAALVRCALESLALGYRSVLGEIEEVTGRRIDAIHVVGGGAQNRLLNQMTADATGRHVLAGPIEATAVGNLLGQALGLGIIGSLEEGRELVRRSQTLEAFAPAGWARWDAARERVRGLSKEES